MKRYLLLLILVVLSGCSADEKPAPSPEPTVATAEPISTPTPVPTPSATEALLQKYASFMGFSQDGKFFEKDELAALISACAEATTDSEREDTYAILKAGFTYPPKDRRSFDSEYISALKTTAYPLLNELQSDKEREMLAFLCADAMFEYVVEEFNRNNIGLISSNLPEHGIIKFDRGYDRITGSISQSIIPSKCAELTLTGHEQADLHLMKRIHDYDMEGNYEKPIDNAELTLITMFLIENGQIGALIQNNCLTRFIDYEAEAIITRYLYETRMNTATADYWKNAMQSTVDYCMDTIKDDAFNDIARFGDYMTINNDPVLKDIYQDAIKPTGSKIGIPDAFIALGFFEDPGIKTAFEKYTFDTRAKDAYFGDRISFTNKVLAKLNTSGAERFVPSDPQPDYYVMMISPVIDPVSGTEATEETNERDAPITTDYLYYCFNNGDMKETYDPNHATYRVELRLEYKRNPHDFNNAGIYKPQYDSVTYFRVTNLVTGKTSKEISISDEPFDVGESVPKSMLDNATVYYARPALFEASEYTDLFRSVDQ